MIPANNVTLDQRRELRESFVKDGGLHLGGLRPAWVSLYGQQFLKEVPDCFGTLTLKNVTYRDGTESTPGRVFTGHIIDRFLKNITTPMVIVEEFGKKNGRRHFHFVGVNSPYVEVMLKDWAAKYGFIKIERLKSPLACMNYIAKYMTKDIDAETARFWVKWT